MVEFILHILNFFTKKKAAPIASQPPTYSELVSSWNDVEALTAWANTILDENEQLVWCMTVEEVTRVNEKFGTGLRDWHVATLAFTIIYLLKNQGIEPFPTKIKTRYKNG